MASAASAAEPVSAISGAAVAPAAAARSEAAADAGSGRSGIRAAACQHAQHHAAGQKQGKYLFIVIHPFNSFNTMQEKLNYHSIPTMMYELIITF